MRVFITGATGYVGEAVALGWTARHPPLPAAAEAAFLEWAAP